MRNAIFGALSFMTVYLSAYAADTNNCVVLYDIPNDDSFYGTENSHWLKKRIEKILGKQDCVIKQIQGDPHDGNSYLEAPYSIGSFVTSLTRGDFGSYAYISLMKHNGSPVSRDWTTIASGEGEGTSCFLGMGVGNDVSTRCHRARTIRSDKRAQRKALKAFENALVQHDLNALAKP
jgi:hypothetical protein